MTLLDQCFGILKVKAMIKLEHRPILCMCSKGLLSYQNVPDLYMVCAALVEHITDFIWFVCISCDMPQFQIFTFRHVLKNRSHQDVPSLYFVVENCSMHGWLGCSVRATLFEVFFSFLIGTHIFSSSFL